jgi:hypothetical protein
MLACGAALLAGFGTAAPALAGEAGLRARLCQGMYIEQDARLGTRADCVSKTHAIEIAPSDEWAEAIGRVLLYARDLGVKPGIALTCAAAGPESACREHASLATRVFAAWNIAATVWRCPADQGSLGDCEARDTP